MNVIVIVSLVVAVPVIGGALIAVAFSAFHRTVIQEQKAAEEEARSYNPGLTYGFKIPLEADVETQLKAARREAARRAAAMPRGANSRIGKGNGEVQTAYNGVEEDPISAVKIATIHSWQGLRSGASFSAAETVTHASAETAPPTKTVDDLEPGKDYEYIEITDDMSPAEKRKARIANVKAKAAAAKALKQSAPAATPAPAKAEAAAPKAAAPAGSEPQPGVDYEVIEITDDMSPDEVRKARIANVKAKAAAMKAYKASGGDVQAAQTGQATTEPTQESAAEPAVSGSAAAAAQIPAPDLIEITDDLAPEEVRKARIHNAKAKAAYKKALKEAGIDPSSV